MPRGQRRHRPALACAAPTLYFALASSGKRCEHPLRRLDDAVPLASGAVRLGEIEPRLPGLWRERDGALQRLGGLVATVRAERDLGERELRVHVVRRLLRGLLEPHHLDVDARVHVRGARVREPRPRPRAEPLAARAHASRRRRTR